LSTGFCFQAFAFRPFRSAGFFVSALFRRVPFRLCFAADAYLSMVRLRLSTPFAEKISAKRISFHSPSIHFVPAIIHLSGDSALISSAKNRVFPGSKTFRFDLATIFAPQFSFLRQKLTNSLKKQFSRSPGKNNNSKN